jgi:hypothetical protein
VGGAGTLDFPLIIHLFVPDFVEVWRSGAGTVLYTVAGTTDGFISYDSTISCSGKDYCYKWVLWSYGGGEPTNATKIWGRGKSTNDYCDGGYDGYYGSTAGGWYLGEIENYCNYVDPRYFYWVKGDDHLYGDDYNVGYPMTRWDYMVGAQARSTRVYYAGAYPE